MPCALCGISTFFRASPFATWWARIKLAHYGLDRYFGFGGFGDQHLERDDVARDLRLRIKLALDRAGIVTFVPPALPIA